VKLVMLGGAVFEVGMKTASRLLKIMSVGLASGVQSTSQTCAFKWYPSCLNWLTVG
jgi:hypothetical protein